MRIRTEKPHANDVTEHTFLLCKPDAEQYHRDILQIVSDEGFHVLAKRFTITPELAEKIASTFQSVRQSMSEERCEGKSFRIAKNAHLQVEGPLFTEQCSEGAADVGVNGTDAEEDVTWDEGGSIIKRRCAENAAHHGIMAEILQLTRRDARAGGGVNAGLPFLSSDEGNEVEAHHAAGVVEDGGDTGGDHKVNANTNSSDRENGDGEFDPHSIGDDMQQGQSPHRRVSPKVATRTTVLGGTRFETMSSRDLLREHVRHLAFGGTCLAVELSRQNAVERLLELVGPENPADARRAAPKSIRASLGKDVVRNAVHAASNLAEAGHCISAVFGFRTHYSTADMRTHSVMQDSAGAKIYQQGPQSQGMVRPYSELVVSQRCSWEGKPMSRGIALRINNANPQAHISYYTGRVPEDEEAVGSPAEGIAAQNKTTDASEWRKKAELLEEQLAKERSELGFSAKLLRVWELDLLLREHALENDTRGLSAPSLPLPTQRETRRRSRPVTMSLMFEGGFPPTGLLSPIPLLQQSQGTGVELDTNQEMQSPENFITHSGEGQSACFSTQNFSPLMPMVEAEDLPLLLSKPVRLRALFTALRRCSKDGDIMWSDIMGLYDRSLAIQLIWLNNHRDFFQCYMEQHTEEPLSFDSFVFLLMFLLRQ